MQGVGVYVDEVFVQVALFLGPTLHFVRFLAVVLSFSGFGADGLGGFGGGEAFGGTLGNQRGGFVVLDRQERRRRGEKVVTVWTH